MSRFVAARLSAVLVAAAAALSACAPSEVEVLGARLCLNDEADRTRFVTFLSDYAGAHHMRVADISAASQRDEEYILKSQGRPIPKVHEILITLQRDDPLFDVTVAAQGQSALQPAIFFMAGKTTPGARQDANALIASLSEQWPVDVLPAGQAVTFEAHCRATVKR